MTNKLFQLKRFILRSLVRQGLPAGRQGFTLIEMMVAVLLLTLAIGGPLTISGKALVVALVAKDQTTAFYLAQDAIEYVRYARDTNRLSGGDWLTGLGATPAGIDLSFCVSATGSARCTLDSLGGSPAVCSGACNVMRYDTTTKQFGYDTNDRPTIYRRTVSITSPNNGAADEAVLRVTVEWSDLAGSTRVITVTEDLFNWQ